MSEALQVVQTRQAIQPSSQRSIDLFRPTSFMEALEFAKVLAESQMVPKQYIGKPYAIIATWQYGLELGVGLMQALQGISNINGTPAVFGDLGWALVQNHPDFVDSFEEVTDSYAICTLKRRGRSDKTWKYTIEMARVANLLGKDNWKNNPKRMLQWRARSWTMRDQFPDSLKGMVMADEAMDYPDAIEGNVQPYATAQAVEEQKQEPVSEPIGAPGGTLFYKTYSANGWTREDANVFMFNKWGITPPQDSRSIPSTGKYSDLPEDLRQAVGKLGFSGLDEILVNGDAIDWASKPKPQAENMDAEPA